MTPSLRRLIVGPKEWNFGVGNLVEVRWLPQPIPPDLRDEAERFIQALDLFLEPASRDWISGRTATLLSHYWVKDTPAPVLAHVAGDWIDILSEYPARSIQAACLEWLKTEKWAPRPADIVDLIEANIGDAVRERHRLRQCLAESNLNLVKED